MDLGLRDRHALVLGGSAGIGRAVAMALGAEGARVSLVGRHRERVEDTARAVTASWGTALGRIGPHPGPALGVLADLTAPGMPEEAVQQARERFGPVDIVVLNGGGPPRGTAATLGTHEVDALTALLLRPPVAVLGLVVPGMRARGWGRVVAVGSSGIAQPIPGLAASNVGRAALAGYLKTLAAEVATDGVTVNLVLPGRIRTGRVEQIDHARAQESGRTPEQERDRSEAGIPAGRYGRPEEFAAVVAFLAGEPASYVTGSQIRCDGGLIGGH